MPDKELLLAASDLIRRTGCIDLEIGHSDDAGREWWAVARYQGTKVIYESTGPDLAAFGLAMKLLDGGRCKCGKRSTLIGAGDDERCLWVRTGERFNSGCDAPSMKIDSPGDLAGAEREWRKRANT